eukprot:TRINITY_DN6547_c0_g1_i2.p4 TRINITY_DN6547_c0_g1~~TRINITY_DN6547_c0_g1_i2.p4  ORF type:complete len:108 (+),score=14.43 TRINITY_DN6547_c0_g1_i2:238-561(+)
MPKPQQPEFKGFMEKKLKLTLNANRRVSGTMRGYDQFMNIVLDKAHDDKEDVELGMVVIRGNSIETIEIATETQAASFWRLKLLQGYASKAERECEDVSALTAMMLL